MILVLHRLSRPAAILIVLAVLAVAGERGVSRDRLQALFWPESDPDRARKVLAQTVYAIRRDLGQPDAVLGTSELRLNPEIITARPEVAAGGSGAAASPARAAPRR